MDFLECMTVGAVIGFKAFFAVFTFALCLVVVLGFLGLLGLLAGIARALGDGDT